MSDPVIVGMASFPPRKDGMIQVVNALLPQCDKFYLYLNGYKERPTELPITDKLVIALAGPGCQYKDIGSQGKFFWLGKDDGFYLSVDDDIFYPNDYVDYMITGVDRYHRRAIVGLHGGIYRVRAGGPMPVRGFAKDQRTLYPYDKAVSRDMGVHILGAGVMAMHPKALGISFDVCKGPVHSGDDEDIAIWAQQHKVPLVRLQGRVSWVTPNPKMWIRDPLHRRSAYIAAADTKLKQWRTWTIYPTLPLKDPTVSLAPKKEIKMKPAGPSFDNVLLNDADRKFCTSILSSDGLAALIVDRIKRKIATSVIRMSDGERAVIAHSLSNKPLDSFLKDEAWLRRYGLLDADFKKIGADLLWAGKHADFLACTISGIFWDCFKVHPYFPERTQFIDQFYPQMWSCTDRVGAILRAGSVLVLHREQDWIVPALKEKYQLPEIHGLILNSWRDHEKLIAQLPAHPSRTVLVSGGASGKAFCVRLAQATNKVVLDVGEALVSTWIK